MPARGRDRPRVCFPGLLWHRSCLPLVSGSLLFRVGDDKHAGIDRYRIVLGLRASLDGCPARPSGRSEVRIAMQFREILKMALASLGANKLRAALTMAGITIGVFSIISVMTAIGALQASIENGISFLGSNIFQFAKYPVNIDAGGNVKKKYQNRRNINYQQALRYAQLMQGEAQEIC